MIFEDQRQKIKFSKKHVTTILNKLENHYIENIECYYPHNTDWQLTNKTRISLIRQIKKEIGIQ